MEKDSLGLIETLGLVGAIEAADAGSKAANVTFRGYERGRAGLITVVFTGDVAAVRAAVAAGVAAAKQVGQVVSVDVIARPDRQLQVDGPKPGEHEIPATTEPAKPASLPEVSISERTPSPRKMTAPTSSGGVIEPSAKEIEAARSAAAEHPGLAIAEVEERVSSPALEVPAQARPDEMWREAKPTGGNGDSPAAETVHAEPTPVGHKKEKARKTKPRKKV